MNKIFKYCFYILLVQFVFSCKKDAPAVEPSTQTGKGNLLLHIHTYINKTEVEDLDSIYTSEDGRKISVKSAQAFISSIELVKPDGSIVKVKDAFLQKNGREEYMINNVPVGNYTFIRFNIGLDSLASSTLIANQDTQLTKHAEMWFGNSSKDGVVYCFFEGKIDTSILKTGFVNQMQPFHYRIGTSPNYKQMVLSGVNLSILPAKTEILHLKADYSQFFKGISLNKPESLNIDTKSDNNTSSGLKIGNNLISLISYE